MFTFQFNYIMKTEFEINQKRTIHNKQIKFQHFKNLHFKKLYIMLNLYITSVKY